MPRRRLAPVQDTTSHHLARRFLQLDTDIRLAAAAGGIFPISQDDRPESPVRQYPWDAEIQHPRPRPAHGPIRIRQLENVAKTKPKPTRSVSDPGDAHRLIAHFVRSNETKARSNTVAVSDPSPASSVPSSSVQSTRETGRAFPFPSMTRHSTLENFLELESSANETGREDPLALKLGQILARRAAAATRTISRGSRGSAGRSSSRAGYGGATLEDLDKLAQATRSEKGKEVEREEGARVARPRPPPLDLAGSTGGGRHAKRESVVIDDRSPHEGPSFLARIAGPNTSIAPGLNLATPPAPDPAITGPYGPRNEPEHERRISFSASRDSLRSFVFPAPVPQPEPELEMHVRVQMQSPVHAQFQVVQSPVHAQFQVQQSPVRTHFQVQQSPVRAQFQGQSQAQMRTPIRIQTEVRPVSLLVQASPSSAYESPLESASWAVGMGGASPTVYRASPTMGYRASPTTRHGASPIGYRASPVQRHSDAHVNLLRGLAPLPSHGLPLPAPNRPRSFNLLDRTGLNLPRRFSMHLPPEATAPAPSPPPPAASLMPVVMGTPPKTPSPPVATSSPPRRFVPTPPRASTEQILLSPSAQVASPSPLPTQVASPSPLPIQHMFPTTSPDLVPTRALSPLPPRLRHHTNASHPSDGSGSDEVVFRGSSSSASSSPAKRRRSRVRRHMRVNSDGLARRTMSEGVRSKHASDAGGPRLSEARRTGQALMRRAQTGNGDGGEVSSDGREVVLFIPRAPPPPVPKVPTPPAVGAPTLPTGALVPPVVKILTPPAIKVPTPPAVKVPTPPAVVVDPPFVRVVPVPPPLVRKESIPLPEASPYPGAAQLGPPGALVQSEPASNIVDEPHGGPAPIQSLGPTHKQSLEPLQGSIIDPLTQRRMQTLPWSPPMRVLSREGSFHTAPDSFAEDVEVYTDAELPSGVSVVLQGVSYMDEDRAGYVSTPVHEEVESPMLSAEDDTIPRQDVPERATITSAMRGHVTQPAIVTRQSSREFVRVPGAIPSPPRSATPARRTGRTEGVLTGVFQRGFLVAPVPSPVPSPQSSGSSRTPAHATSIPMRHDDHSPPRPEQLPRSVSPHTEVSVQQEEDSFQSVHTADNVLRLPLDDWLEFAMSSMAAMGIPLTRATLEDLHESEDDSGVAVVTEALSTSSMRGFQEDENSGGLLDGVSQADDDSDGDSPSLSLSPVSGTPSPARSGLFSATGYGGMTTFSTAPPESAGTRPTIRTIDLGYSTDNPMNLSAISGMSASTEESESERAVGGLQDIAVVVRELNLRTPIPSGSSSRAPPSASTSLPMHTPFSGPGSHVGPPSFVGPPPIPGAYHDASPARALSPGAMSITFQESTPTLSSVPPLVVLPEDRDRFADSLLIAEYQHHQPQRSLHNLRDDDYRALDEGEDVVLYGIGGEWERIEGRRIRTESHETAGSGIPIEPADYGLEGSDAQSHSKYTQFVLSLANALRPPNVNRPPRWVEVALRTLRPHAPGTQPSDFYDAISRAEAELEGVPAPVVPSHLGSTFLSSSTASTPKSSSIGSALPEDDEIVEAFIESILTPAHTPPPQPITPIQTDTPDVDPNVIPWPVLASPVMPRFLFAPSSPSSARSGYSSLIPPPPRVRSRSIEPHWLAIYMARRWATAQNHISRRTYSSPSALGPPMPYHWRPICHISPERLWEITNLAVRADMPPPPPPPALSNVESVSPVEIARPHYTTPATTTTYGRITPYSARTVSSHRSGRTTTPAPPPALAPVYPEATGMMTSHPNLPINPSHHSVALQTTTSRTSIPLVQRPLDPQYVPRSSTSSDRPTQTAVVSSAVTPAGVQRKRTVRDLVGRLVGKGRTRVRSISNSRSPSPLVSRSRFGLAGKVVDVARRVMRYPRRRARVSSIRSQRAQAVRDA